MAEMTPPIFLVSDLPSGESAVLDGAEAHHAATVRRIRAGERLALADGAGSVAECTVHAVHPGRHPRLDLWVETRWYDEPPALRVTIAQALVKADRARSAVELATEAGADAILPWRAARSVAQWEEGTRGAKALQRWRTTAQAAAKQARRSRVPVIDEPVTTEQLATRIGSADSALVLEGAAGEAVRNVAFPERGELLVVVGPEGGSTEQELQRFSAAGAVGVRLGPTVLRTSTAAAVALGALGVLTRRWD